MSVIILNSTEWYLLDSLKKMCPEWFKYSNLDREVMRMLKLNVTDYIYAHLRKNEWVVSTSKYTKAKILLSKKYVNDYKMSETCNISDITVISSSTNEDDSRDYDSANSSFNNSAYALIPYTENIVIDGKEHKIKIRGKLTVEDILFNLIDVAKEFNINNLQKMVLTSYDKKIDYKVIEIEGVKYSYFTYYGLLKCMFTLKGSATVKELQKWLSNVLFSYQSEYEMSSYKLSCIYLLFLGTYNYYENECSKSKENVYKFGRTDNFSRRYTEHNRFYGCTSKIITIQYIDPDYLSNAENDLKQDLMNLGVEFVNIYNQKELVCIDSKQLNIINSIFTSIGCKYASDNNQLKHQILTLQNEIELMKKDYEILELKNKILELKTKI